MRTIYVSPEFPLNRRMRKDVRRGKLQVVREGGERSSLGGGIPSGKRRAFRTTGSPLVCMADNGAEVGRGGAKIPQGVCTLAELLSGNIRMSLPFYQREYTWQRKNHDELWEDILGIRNRSEGKLHYMGSVTLERESDAPGGYRIIDGQQRLISLCLMAGACVRKLRGIANARGGSENHARADEIARMFLVNNGELQNGADMKVRMLNLEGHNDHNYFQNLMFGSQSIASLPNPLNPTQENLRNALRRFHLRFGALTDGADCFEFVRTHAGEGLLFAPIVLGDKFQKQGHKVYATLNFRGLQLTDAHVIKAHLLAEISENELRNCTKRWADLLKKIGEKEMVGFLRHAFHARYKAVGDAELSDSVKSVVSESDESKTKVMDYLNDLHKKADFYVKLKDPNNWRSKDTSSVRFLKAFGIKALTPMLMSAYEQFSEDDFSYVLRLCEAVMLRRSMVGLAAAPMASFACDAAFKIHVEKRGEEIRKPAKIHNRTELHDYFKERNNSAGLYPSDSAFGDGIFKKFPVAIAPRLHCLARLEQFLSGGEYPHILPARIMPLLSKVDLKNLKLSSTLLSNLENLVLWENGVEDVFAVMSYEERMGALRNSQYKFSQKTAEKWPQKKAEVLGERGEWIKELAVQIWNLDKCNE